MPAWAEETDRKLCIIASHGTLDGAYPSLIMAQAALGEGVDTHLFFTFWGMDIITKGKQENLAVTPVGNPSMGMPQAVAPFPGMSTMATKMMKRKIDELDVPEVPELVQMIVDMGGTLWACRMSVDMMDLEMEDFVDGVKDIISAADFIELAEDSQIIFT